MTSPDNTQAPDPAELLVITRQDYAQIQQVMTDAAARITQLQLELASAHAELATLRAAIATPAATAPAAAPRRSRRPAAPPPPMPHVQVAGTTVVNGQPTAVPLRAASREAAAEACPWCGAAPTHIAPHTNPARAAQGVRQQHYACGKHRYNLYPS